MPRELHECFSVDSVVVDGDVDDDTYSIDFLNSLTPLVFHQIFCC